MATLVVISVSEIGGLRLRLRATHRGRLEGVDTTTQGSLPKRPGFGKRLGGIAVVG